MHHYASARHLDLVPRLGGPNFAPTVLGIPFGNPLHGEIHAFGMNFLSLSAKYRQADRALGPVSSVH